MGSVSRFQQNTTDIINYHITMEALPDLSAMDKQALASLVMELYERSCKVFGDTFDIQHQVRKLEIEISELEVEVNDMNGRFVIPKLRKVRNLHLTAESED